MRSIFLSVLFFALVTTVTHGQTYNYVNGTLDITIDVKNPCGSPAPNNGRIDFTVNAADGGSTTLIFLDGPGSNDIFAVPILVGNTFSFNATGTLPDGTYQFIIQDALGNFTINTFSDPGL